MEKKYRVQVFVSDRKTPTCKQDDCEVSEQPSHWVDIELAEPYKSAPELIERAKALLEHRETPIHSPEATALILAIRKAEGRTK